MKIVGCDLHTRYQQIAMLDEETGELVERRQVAQMRESEVNLSTENGPGAGRAKRVLPQKWVPQVRVSGPAKARPSSSHVEPPPPAG